MRNGIRKAFQTGILLAAAITWSAAQTGQGQNPLTNQDVIRMVRNAVPESVILSAIRASSTNFDTSVDALIALHKAGASKRIMDAMMAAGTNRQPPTAAPAPSTAAPPARGLVAGGRGQGPTIIESSDVTPGRGAVAPAVAGQPSVVVLPESSSGAVVHVGVERTQLAETKTKPTSMTSLASDSALTQGLQAGVTSATTQAMTHTNSAAAGTSFSQAGSIFSSVLAHRKPTVTYVWALPGGSSSNSLETSMPRFRIDFSSVLGIDPEEFQPAIVKLTPSQTAWRLVGATRGKEDARSNSVADWQIYSGFLEDRVIVTSQKRASGHYEMSPASPLVPGEYAIVLRPIAKDKKFSGGDVARYQGDGMVFDSAWSFQIPRGLVDTTRVSGKATAR